MVTQSFYTPSKISQMLNIPEEKVIEFLKSGQLKGTFIHTAANWVVTHGDFLAFLRVRKDFKMMQQVINPKVILVDRDSRVQDIMRVDLGRNGCEVKTATSDREVAFMVKEYEPDVICVPLGATQRPNEPVKESLLLARKQKKTYIILYHTHLPDSAETPEVKASIQAVGADLVLSICSGIMPLVEAVRAHLGLKLPKPGVGRKPTWGR